MPDSPPRPAVAVVMPFAGTPLEAAAALAVLDGLALRDGDVVVLADNSGTAPAQDPRVHRAPGEASPSRARNAGAAAAPGPGWLLFIDADAAPDPGLLDAFFAGAIPDDVGALAGAIAAVAPGPGAPLAARYGAARNFLDSDAHLRHPFRPRVAAANLLVRRAAFDAVGGFQEGIRTAEDTDFCWRLQDAGWRLGVRPAAVVRHAYRPTLRGLRAQWRSYAAGRAWLARRYPGFTPEPALLRVARRALGRGQVPAVAAPPEPPAPGAPDVTSQPPRRTADHGRGLAGVDVILGFEELLGLGLANRPAPVSPSSAGVPVVVAAGRPPAAGTVQAATRIEAGHRPPGSRATPALPGTAYREDDGALQRATAFARLALAHPRAVVADRRRRAGGPPLSELAPVIARVGDAEIHAAGGDPASERIAARLRALRR